jgi:SnoaL-like domain
VDRRTLQEWVELYERAWRSPGTELVSELFARDATYSEAPFREPRRGLDEIERLWEEERDGPDEPFTMAGEIVAVEGDTGVVRVEVSYERPPQLWRDLWVVRFGADGRCVAFEEWPFAPKRG